MYWEFGATTGRESTTDMSEQASAEKKEEFLIQALRTTPIFPKLLLSQLKRILGSCQYRRYDPGDKDCQSVTASGEIYILLSDEVTKYGFVENLWIFRSSNSWSYTI